MDNVMKDERRSSRNMVFEYLVPSSGWTENADSHFLLIDLPGFKREDVRIRADNHGHLIVSGESQANCNKIIHFEQSFKVPASCDIEETSATLEDEIYYVTLPKKKQHASQVQTSITSVQENDQNTLSDSIETFNGNSDGDFSQSDEEKNQEEEEFHDAKLGDEWVESNLLDKILKKLKKNRCLAFTAVLAFSLGVVVSHRYQSNPHIKKSE